MKASSFQTLVSVPLGLELEEPDRTRTNLHMAVCRPLGIVTVSYLGTTRSPFSFVDVYDLDAASLLTGKGLVKRCTLGQGVAPMQFYFGGSFYWSGYMAYTDSCLLVLSDCCHEAVHVIDVLSATHVGFVVEPVVAGRNGAWQRPRAVAAQGSTVAVGFFVAGSESCIRLYGGSGASWSLQRVLGHNTSHFFSLKFTRDGSSLLTSVGGNYSSSAVLLVDLASGSQQTIHSEVDKTFRDVEECEDGTLMAAVNTLGVFALYKNPCSRNYYIQDVVRMGATFSLASFSEGFLVVGKSDYGTIRNELYVLTGEDAIAMACISALRVAWMVAVARGKPRCWDVASNFC
jgi:hypothetical protein